MYGCKDASAICVHRAYLVPMQLRLDIDCLNFNAKSIKYGLETTPINQLNHK